MPTYLDINDPAIQVIEDRIGDTGKNGNPPYITYTALVTGVVFHPLTKPAGYIVASSGEWTHVDSALIGEYLDYISLGSHAKFGFLASALVVGAPNAKNSGTPLPGPGFYDLAEVLGLANSKTSKQMVFTIEAAKAVKHYQNGGTYRMTP